ncbi:hypothetical protein CW357_17420 [Rummeliibacillus sp. TYF005]|uniref:hypothetical protein n=1 Tax=Rummeliibacillus sp. TYF005 TaxID=2058214 RepID=UPI000F546BA7|nr:hypothetical protein [Rummeliibacillus sp. TYF005]RPJ94059.1 hypothetical protein CW357_17420 [Rummeliibacillus sp. TYF005]
MIEKQWMYFTIVLISTLSILSIYYIVKSFKKGRKISSYIPAMGESSLILQLLGSIFLLLPDKIRKLILLIVAILFLIGCVLVLYIELFR